MGREIVWSLLKFFKFIFRKLPHRIAIGLGSGLGLMVWALSKKRVDRAEARCVRTMGIGPTPARHIVRESYRNHGRCAAEILRMPVVKKRYAEYVSVHGEDNLRRALDAGKGVVLLTAHLGSWEVAAGMLALMGYPINAIGAEQRDGRITDLIIKVRESCGVSTIGKGFNLRSAIRCLRSGEALGILLDQDAKDKGMVAPFLGQPASTPFGPVKMAHRLGCAVVPLFMIRRPDGVSHDLYLLPQLEGMDGTLFGENLEESVIICNNCLSEWISRFPEQWMWLYPRWASTLGDR